MRDQSLAANLRRLSLLTHDWPGQPLDEHGTIRLLNPDAAGPPLFWCFNGQQEFPALAAAFARQRPLVGMRSLNQIMPEGPGRYFPDRHLQNIMPQQPCDNSGRCPVLSAAIARPHQWRTSLPCGCWRPGPGLSGLSQSKR